MLKTENKLTATIYYVPTFNTDPIVFLEQVGESLEISTFPLTLIVMFLYFFYLCVLLSTLETGLRYTLTII